MEINQLPIEVLKHSGQIIIPAQRRLYQHYIAEPHTLGKGLRRQQRYPAPARIPHQIDRAPRMVIAISRNPLRHPHCLRPVTSVGHQVHHRLERIPPVMHFDRRLDPRAAKGPHRLHHREPPGNTGKHPQQPHP